MAKEIGVETLTHKDARGVDIFHPLTGEIESGGPDTIAVWFIDTDYNEESFFVRHAYFLGANGPYKALKTSLKAEIDESLNSVPHAPSTSPNRAGSRSRSSIASGTR